MSTAIREAAYGDACALRARRETEVLLEERVREKRRTRPLFYALLLGGTALCAAAVFHDSRRQDDWLDVGHGQRAAEYYRDYCQTHSLSFDNRVYLVMAFHDRDDVLGEAALTEQESGILLYHIFKDADALDRFRLGPNGLDIRYLRTAEGKSLYRYAEQFERGDANA